MTHLRRFSAHTHLAALGPSSILALASVLSGAACGGTVEAESPTETRSSDGTPDAGLPTINLPPMIVLPPASSGPSGTTAATVGEADASTTTTTASLPDATAPIPDAGVDAPRPGLLAVALSSCIPSEYTASVTLGGSQVFQMVIDTGSTTLGVASSACTDCEVSPEYTPGSMAIDTHQTGDSQYGSGSWSGEIYTDSVSVAGSPKAPVSFVAIDSQSQFFQPTLCDSAEAGLQGILGLGPKDSALPGTNAFFDQLVATSHLPDIFATELCDAGGTLWLGGYDPTFTTAKPQYTPLATSFLSEYYYAVSFTSLTVAGKTIPIATEQYPDSVVDTGTSVFILPTDAFNAATAAIEADEGFKKVFGPDASAGVQFFSSPDACVTLSQTKAELDAMLPPLKLTFAGNPAITVKAVATESYLSNYEGEWCSSLYPLAPGPDFPLASILGSPVLMSSVVIFDRENSRVGFAPHKACP